MTMPERYVHLDFHIDTNCVNARALLSDMNRLERWHEEGIICIEMCRKAQDEAAQGQGAARARKAGSYIYSETMAGTPQEQEILGKINRILFPDGAKTSNQWNDVEIVFNAWKYKNILVTNDGGSKRQPGGILGNRERLADLGIRAMSPSEAVSEVEQAIQKRDHHVMLRIMKTGEEPPDWVSRDLQTSSQGS
jgi:hypothetical protein